MPSTGNGYGCLGYIYTSDVQVMPSIFPCQRYTKKFKVCVCFTDGQTDCVIVPECAYCDFNAYFSVLLHMNASF